MSDAETKARRNATSRAWYAKNKEKMQALRKVAYDPVAASVRGRKDYARRKDKIKEAHRAWRVANPERAKKLHNDWIAQNRDDYLARSSDYAAERRGLARLATPQWANRFFMREIYSLAALRTKWLGIAHQVDHIVPLDSPIVCGLHVENNMRVIERKKNISKGNRFWPDMPKEN